MVKLCSTHGGKPQRSKLLGSRDDIWVNNTKIYIDVIKI